MAGAGPSTTHLISISDNVGGHLTWSHFLRWILDRLFPCLACRMELQPVPAVPESSTVTGTIICPQNDKVRLCLQQSPAANSLLLLLDFPLYTPDLAAEIDGGVSRFSLVCDRTSPGAGAALLDVPAWTTYCNGRRTGFATRRQVTEREAWVLYQVRTVSVGAGFLAGKTAESGWCKFLRGNFRRVVGSTDCEAYHLMDPSGSLGQELSIFFLRL
ncbi:protein MIZU-KUSSEI 1-like [Aristolochia californica]|uniref:protein MIZU-KUSSEI 1-like n=1 Tax=Aristolochia californica TaxID=171875 RepID=UPI0035DEC020